MGIPGWSRTPAQNAAIDPTVSSSDGGAARDFARSFRGIMAAVRRQADDTGGALVTTGTLNAYRVTTGSGLTELRSGLSLLIKIDRTNTAEATLNVDGLGPLPWVDASGAPIQSGRLITGRFYPAILDTLADGSAVAWRVQSGSTTLDEIPGLIEARDETVSARDASISARDAAREAAEKAQQYPTFSSRAELQAATVDPQVEAVRLLGWNDPSDSGDGLWARSDSTPPLTGKLVSANGVYFELAGAEIRLQQVGGIDDGATANDDALARASQYVRGTGRRLALPAKRQGRYRFANSTDLRGIDVVADRGVTLVGPVEPFEDIRTSSDVAVDYRSGTYRAKLLLAEDYRRPLLKKALSISAGDFDRTSGGVLSGAAFAIETTNATTGDTWTADGGFAATPTSVAWNVSNDGQWRAAFAPVRGGDEISATFALGDYRRAVILRFEGGYVAFEAGASGPGRIITKMYGQAQIVSGDLFWPGYTLESWRAENALWTLRIYDTRRWAILFNGVELFPIQVAPGDIETAGFAARNLGSGVASVMIENMTRERRRIPAGKQPIQLLTIGDSKTADLQGGWVPFARELLDGFRGVRVTAVSNYAVGGDNAEAQLAKLQALGIPAGTNVAVIDIGTNDVQGNASAENTLYSLNLMVNLLQAAGLTPIICIFDLWYATDLAQGLGDPANPTRNYGKGARTRQAIRNYALTKGCPVVDLPQRSGPVLPSLIATDADPYLRDAIHPTPAWYRLKAHAIATKIAETYLPEMTMRVPEFPLPIATPAGPTARIQNGWVPDQVLTYTVSEDGWVRLGGALDPGTKTDGTVILTLPANLRPKNRVLIPCAGNAYTGTIVVLTDGSVLVVGVGGSSRLYLDNISFSLV